MATNHSCSCQRSKCRQKYCECFHAGVLCGPNCKCKDCHNDGRFRGDLHDWMLPDCASLPEAKRSAIGTESVIVLGAQQQGCGEALTSDRRRKQPQQAAAAAEGAPRKFPAVPTLSPQSLSGGPSSWDAKMPPAQRRRILSQREPLPLDSEELTITPEMLEDMMRVSDGDNLNFSMNDPDGLGLSCSPEDELQMCWNGQSSPEDELRLAGCGHLLLDPNRPSRVPPPTEPKQCKSTDAADCKLAEQMRNFNVTLRGTHPPTLQASSRAGNRACTVDVNPGLRYDRNSTQTEAHTDWFSQPLGDDGLPWSGQSSPDGCGGWSGGSGWSGGVAVSHNEEPRSRDPFKPADSLSSVPGSLTASGGDAFMTELLGGDLQRISGRLSGKWDEHLV